MLDHQQMVAERQATCTLNVYENVGAFKLRIVVHIDSSYDNQSWGKAEVWSDVTGSWNQVATFHPSSTSYRTKCDDAYAAADTLRSIAAEVLV